MLTELETQNRKEAHQDFVEAVWAGEVPWRLLALAKAAGLGGDEADALIVRVAQAKEQMEQVDRLPRLRKDAAGATGRFEKVQARARAEIARLESQIRYAAHEADVARKAVNDAAAISRQLLAMYDEGLLPATEVPDEILRLIERREAAEKFRQVDAARVDALNERDRLRAIVRDIEERLATLPISLTSSHDESVLQGRLKDARRHLADAESRVKKAEAAADAARKAIP